MITDEEILKNIESMGRGRNKCFVGVVKENYPDEQYIDVEMLSGTLYTEVRKRAAIDSSENGILVTPVTGSTVIVNRIGESDELYIALFSNIESIIIDTGKNGGIVIAPELVTQLAKLTARVDGIIAAIKCGVTVAQDGGASLKTTIVAKLNTLTDKENFENIENEKIKH